VTKREGKGGKEMLSESEDERNDRGTMHITALLNGHRRRGRGKELLTWEGEGKMPARCQHKSDLQKGQRKLRTGATGGLQRPRR